MSRDKRWYYSPYNAMVFGLAPALYASARVDTAIVVAIAVLLVVPTTQTALFWLARFVPKPLRILAPFLIGALLVTVYELLLRVYHPTASRQTILMVRLISVLPFTWWPDAVRTTVATWQDRLIGAAALAAAFIVALAVLTAVRLVLAGFGLGLIGTVAAAFALIGCGLVIGRIARLVVRNSAPSGEAEA